MYMQSMRYKGKKNINKKENTKIIKRNYKV